MTTKLSCASINLALENGLNQIDKRLSSIEVNNNSMANDITEIKNQIIESLKEANFALQNKVSKLEEKIDDLNSEIEGLNTEINRQNQYGRRNNLEFSGIPNSISDDKIESTVCKILGEIGVPVEENEIEACHRLPAPRRSPNKNKNVIVRFVNRKKCQKTLENKKKLSNINMSTCGLPVDTAIYVSENLNKFYQKLLWRCRKLKKGNKIKAFKYQNESVIITLKNDQKKKVLCDEEILEFFPNFDFENNDIEQQ